MSYKVLQHEKWQHDCERLQSEDCVVASFIPSSKQIPQQETKAAENALLMEMDIRRLYRTKHKNGYDFPEISNHSLWASDLTF